MAISAETDDGPGCGCALGCVFLVTVLALVCLMLVAVVAMLLGFGESVSAVATVFASGQ